MIESFEAHACTVTEMEDINTFLIVIADQAESPRHYIELQRSIEQEEQDKDVGMDTYCVVTSSGATNYGGILSCTLTDESLTLEFSDEAKPELGLEGYKITLALSNMDKSILKAGLIKLFYKERYMPKHLNI